jgi:endonuclease YncB( thermonuclease family)
MNNVLKMGGGAATVTAILAALYASGGCFGEYCVWKKSDGAEMRAGRVPTYATRILDGDTFELGDGKNGTSGDGVTIRLADVSAPELTQCFGAEAKDALERLLMGQQLTVLKDISAQDTYGRDVRFVRIDKPSRTDKNILVNEWMLQNGYGWYVSSENKAFQREMVEAQNDALARRLGLWGGCSDDERRAMGIKNVTVSAAAPNETCTIKGNIAESDGAKRYYFPICINYQNIIIDAARGEQYFCDEVAAKKAGFIKSGNCK